MICAQVRIFKFYSLFDTCISFSIWLISLLTTNNSNCCKKRINICQERKKHKSVGCCITQRRKEYMRVVFLVSPQ